MSSLFKAVRCSVLNDLSALFRNDILTVPIDASWLSITIVGVSDCSDLIPVCGVFGFFSNISKHSM